MPTVYVTVPVEEADRLAETLVTERLAACVNRFRCTSRYRWEGEVECEEEAALLVKTTDERYEDLCERVLELHPHDVPCIERFDPRAVHGPYRAWVESAVD